MTGNPTRLGDADPSVLCDVDVVALDVDGTLLAEAGDRLADRFVELHRLLATHQVPVDFVLVTGRPWAGVRGVVRAFESVTAREAPHVVHFGSVVATGDRVVDRTAIPPSAVADLVEVFRSHGAAPSAIECRPDLSEVHWCLGGRPPAVYDFGVPVCRVQSLPEGVDAQVLLATMDPAPAERLLVDLESLGTGLPMAYHAPSGVLYVDSAGASKRRGLAVALDRLGVPPERALSVGDAAPDVAMFELVRVGVAVATASPEVVDAADYVSLGGPSDAVVEVLEVVLAARTGARWSGRGHEAREEGAARG